MMIAALVALAAGAAAGIYLATRHFLRKRLPVSVALFHGLGGATGFALVLLTAVREPAYRPIQEVLYLLIGTVLLGVVNLLFHVRKVRHRTSLIVMHGLTAVISAAMLIRAIVLYPGAADAESVPAQPPAAEPAPPAAEPQAAAPAPPTEAAEPAAAAADAVPPSAPAEPPPAKGADAGEPAIDEAVARAFARPIQFETSSATIRRSSLADIGELAKLMKAHPEIGLLEVQGHADERGEDARNVALTRGRAAAVVDALAARGVARDRLHSAGYGARCPADEACRRPVPPDSCHAEDAWQRDRRVVFRVLRVGETAFRGEVVCARGADLIPQADLRFHAPDAEPE